MRALRDFVYFAFLVAGLASPASAQFGRPGPGQRPPEIRGILNPAIGSGAVYQSSTGETEIGLVGTENIKTAAGTFKCEHYQANDGSWDSWVAADVPPWGLVKSKDASGEMVLLRTLTGVADRVKGTPQKLELPEGMPNRTRPSRANPSQ